MTDNNAEQLSATKDGGLEVDIPLRALGTLGAHVLAIVLVVAALGRAQELLGLAVLAAVLALVLTPLVNRVGSVIGNVAATVVVHLVLVAMIMAATGLVVHQIRIEAAALESYAQEQIDEATNGDRTALLSRAGVSERLSEAAVSWGTIAVVGDDEAAGIAGRVSQLAVVAILSIFFTLQVDRLLDSAMGLTEDRELRRRLRDEWAQAVHAANQHLRAALVVAAGNGVAAGVVASSIGVRGVLLLAFWAGLLSIVPIMGTAAGWAPLVVMVALSGTTAELVAAVIVALIALAATAVVRSRLPMSFRPGHFIASMGVAAGLSAGGLAGAAAGLFVAVAGAQLLAAGWRDIARSHAEYSATRAEDEPDMTEDTLANDGGVLGQSVKMRLSPRTLRRVSTVIVGAFMVQLALTKVGPTLIWAVVGVLLAIGLDRPVSWAAARWNIRRAIVVMTGAVAVAVLVGGIISTGRSSLASSFQIDDDIPQLVETLQTLPLVGDQLAEQNLTERIESIRVRAPLILNRADAADRAVTVAGGGLVAMFWIAVATMAALIDGPRLIDAIDRRVPATYTRQVSRLASAAQGAIASYVGGSALVASLNAIIVTAMSLALGLPMPAVLGLWAFSWNFVPQIGGIIGWAPVVILALATGPIAGAAALLVFVIYQAVENNVIQPTVLGHAVDLSALAALGAALFGAAVAGLIGAVLAIPVVGVALALRTEYQRDDFPTLRPSPTDPSRAAG